MGGGGRGSEGIVGNGKITIEFLKIQKKKT